MPVDPPDPRALVPTLQALSDGEDRDQVREVFGHRAPSSIAAALESLVEEALGVSIVRCTYTHVSVGVVLELELTDRAPCVIKACCADEALKHRAEALRVQAELARRGFPAPAVLAPLTACAGAHVCVTEAIDRGESLRYDTAVRDVMAEQLARLVTLAESIEPSPRLRDGRPPAGRLWPTPHSVIFDFEATRAGAEPIDAIATAARSRLQQSLPAEPSVVAHTDWSLQNVALRDGRLIGVFDWDSVMRTDELSAVAGAAAFHMQDWRYGPDDAAHDFYPGPEQTLAFVDTYARARGLDLTGSRQAVLEAAVVYRLGYQARCQHALDPTAGGPAIDRLFRFARAFGLA